MPTASNLMHVAIKVVRCGLFLSPSDVDASPHRALRVAIQPHR